MGIKFKFFKAGHGDSIYITTDKTNILIDGGTLDTYDDCISDIYENLKDDNANLDLVILTHIDNDHIEGLVELLEEEKRTIIEDDNYIPVIKDIWFNSLIYEEGIFKQITKNSYSGADELVTFRDFVKDICHKVDFKDYISIDNETILKKNDIEFILLSPNDEKLKNVCKKHGDKLKYDYTSASDESAKNYSTLIEELAKKSFKKNGEAKAEIGDRTPNNGSSIAFILIYDNKKYLFLADAHMDIVVESLKKQTQYFNSKGKIEFEFVKLSHHGSKENLNQHFLNLIETDNFIILTNGLSHGHPDDETLSRIIINMERKTKNSVINFIFNYQHMVHHPELEDIQKEKKFKMIHSNIYPLREE
jgi:beta-lactamase superfamily II metal-dependent hydrolase